MTKKKFKAFGTRLGVSNLTVYISRHASNDTKKMETGLHQHLPSAFLDELDFLVHMTCM